MKTMDIMYDDLNAEAQAEFDKLFGPPDEFNHDIAPLAIIDHEEDGE